MFQSSVQLQLLETRDYHHLISHSRASTCVRQFQEIQARTPSVAGSRRPSGSGNVSFFPFPPLQRRLSEALLALGSCRAGSSFESNNLGFQRGRLQPAVSCNTLRVPTTESGTQSYTICMSVYNRAVLSALSLC